MAVVKLNFIPRGKTAKAQAKATLGYNGRRHRLALLCFKKRAKHENNAKFKKPILAGKQVRTEADH